MEDVPAFRPAALDAILADTQACKPLDEPARIAERSTVFGYMFGRQGVTEVITSMRCRVPTRGAPAGKGEAHMVVRVRLRILGTGGDGGRTEEDTAKLRAELRELDVEDVQLAPGAGPLQGSRAASAAEIGGLLITAVETPVVLGQMVSIVRDWLFRNRGRCGRHRRGRPGGSRRTLRLRL